MQTPTQKGEHSCKCTELSLKRKEGIVPRYGMVPHLLLVILSYLILDEISVLGHSNKTMAN